MIRVLIADDHLVIVEGLKALLANVPEIKIVGHANNGREVINLLETQNIDVILLDINMPVLDGLETTRLIREHHDHVKVLILSMYNKPEFIRNLIEIGANGYVLKNTAQEELVAAIKDVHEGREHFSAEVQDTINESLKSKGHVGAEYLTDRERAIIRLLADGMTTGEIAVQLSISSHTVDTHRKNLMTKLNQKNIASLIKYAVEKGYAGEQF
ncbi:response regulator transcription factor [Reichenbachiella agarivorans]|uniref:Response regulator transcription factor n=1 Tax=Reichenbachiella agarivorans TaxID=2979464 RepID=A0ABY6CLV2_9BACT|nr:response regulator transcription factor [Reichenbachiella agarivorans]UXP30704.1 response regulator transcription factor [Reichenbachiella agarivorans]